MGQGQSRTSSISVHKDNFIPGAPVIRGPDWNSTNRPPAEDASGSLTGHLVSVDPITDLITVKWANGTTKADYRGKPGGPYDLSYACRSEPLTASNFQANGFCGRGPDWRWGDQDKSGGGRAISLTGNWVRVRWNDGCENSYRAGAEGKHDIVIFHETNPQNSNNDNSNNNQNNNTGNSTTTATTNLPPIPTLASNQPAPNDNTGGAASPPPPSSSTVIPEGCPVHSEGVVIGAVVKRGPDWKTGDNSDASGNGALLGVDSSVSNKVRVKWQDGSIVSYRAGPDFYDLIYAQAAAQTANGNSNATNGAGNNIVTKANYKTGALVVRGPDWNWGDQDKTPGKLVEMTSGSGGDWARVKWRDNAANSYRIGANDKFDLCFDPSSGNGASSTQQRQQQKKLRVITKLNFIANVKIKRGPDWKWGNQDGNGAGKAISIDNDGWIRVEWANGTKNTYRAGAEGKHDIAFFDDAVPGAAANNTATATNHSNNSPPATTSTVPPQASLESRKITATNFRVGAPVVRGPDWKYASQDSSGNGKLVSIDADGWARVQWADGTSNGYRSGADGKFDVLYADSSANNNSGGSSQNMGAPLTTANAKVGIKVVRGPDWNWADQDKSGPGTLESIDGAGWGRVRWPDGTSNSYRCGVDGKSDVALLPAGSAAATTNTTTPASPRTLPGRTNVTRENFVPNAIVVRGPDWKWGEQDGKPPGEGNLVSIDSDNWVRVSWKKTGIQNSYRGGVSNAYDIAYPGPAPTPPPRTTPARTNNNTNNASTAAPTPTVAPKDGDKVSNANFKAGQVISRGPDWKWGEQDKGGEGKTVSIDAQGWVKVQWSDGTINSYRAGANGAYDIRYGKKRSNSPKKDLPAPRPTDNPDEACVVCLTNIREFCCVPCGHVTLCPGCVNDIEASKNKKCPICREPYQMLMRIYK